VGGIVECLKKQLLLTLKQYHFKDNDIEFILRAFNLAREKHGDTTRESGELYFNHPFRVALSLIKA
jgi:(p)ppGpp synthase/HD superfamily hydrolase